jgi:hypothetical protein
VCSHCQGDSQLADQRQSGRWPETAFEDSIIFDWHVFPISFRSSKVAPADCDQLRQLRAYGRRLHASDRIGFFEDDVEGHGYQLRKREAALAPRTTADHYR